MDTVVFSERTGVFSLDHHLDRTSHTHTGFSPYTVSVPLFNQHFTCHVSAVLHCVQKINFVLEVKKHICLGEKFVMRFLRPSGALLL